MSKSLAEFNQLTDAEQYLQFFGLPYDPDLVNVNRLHILQKFSNAIKSQADELQGLSETETLDRYKIALQSAYDLFTTSNSVEQKLFKVFKEKPKNIVMLSEIGTEG